jgi:hypothetical protein
MKVQFLAFIQIMESNKNMKKQSDEKRWDDHMHNIAVRASRILPWWKRPFYIFNDSITRFRIKRFWDRHKKSNLDDAEKEFMDKFIKKRKNYQNYGK